MRETNLLEWSVSRKTPEYGRMKWNLAYWRIDGTRLSSEWFKTKREALDSVARAVWRGKKGFPIGNRMSYTTYKERTNGSD
jgi:hypothetical protein